MVSKIAVVTDSIACLPPILSKKHNILIAPCYVIWDGVQYRDSIDLLSNEFYTRLRNSKTLPTTTSAIQGEFIKIYEALQGKVDGVVTITVTGGMGAAYVSAMAAKELVPWLPMEIIDSRTAYMSQGFAAIAASKVAKTGGSLKEVADAAQNVANKSHTFYAIDTVEYLRKGGRVSLPQEVLGKWLKVKALMIIKDGKLDPSQINGSMEDRLMEVMDQRVNKAGRLHVAVMHGDTNPEELKSRIASKYKPFELITSEITPVIGTHTGPGTLGLCFYNE